MSAMVVYVALVIVGGPAADVTAGVRWGGGLVAVVASGAVAKGVTILVARSRLRRLTRVTGS